MRSHLAALAFEIVRTKSHSAETQFESMTLRSGTSDRTVNLNLSREATDAGGKWRTGSSDKFAIELWVVQ